MLNKSVGPIFPIAFSYLVSLCYILVMLTIIEAFLKIVFVVVIIDLCYCCDSRKVQIISVF